MRNLNSLITAIALTLSTVLVGCASTGGDVTDASNDEASAPGSFDLWQATDGQWHFHLVSGNKRTLLTSEAYTSRTGALNGVLSVMNNGIDPSMYQVVPAAHGYLLHLVAGNNEIIGFTQAYSTKSNATRAIGSCVRAVTSYLDKIEANTTGARGEIEVGPTGEYHFDIFAKNGQVVLSSEHYTTEAAAWNGEFAVQDAAADAANFSILTSANGRFYFNLNASNGQIVGTSQMYGTREAASAGIASVQGTLATLALL
jgi:uncharacterized protein YegP (UPF0339 family)